NLTLYFSSTGRRGLGGGSTIILRCQNVTDSELVGVLVHELGHIKDTGVLKGDFWAGESEFKDGEKAIFQNDLSLDFYRISFANEKALKKGAVEKDFVSGYAMSDPFEDFAETYNFYILHGEQFRKMAEDNPNLQAKYDYMRDIVFEGREYGNYERISYDGDLSKELLKKRNYDSTILEYNLKEFLAI
ncbi:putative zinc-binding metallopeptidase, partial [Candidatus Peregrinibacteria bacterium]|nr:putative zinc-binding metallopeptidase [Candidatus Peregrinibacteria bacterium]